MKRYFLSSVILISLVVMGTQAAASEAYKGSKFPTDSQLSNCFSRGAVPGVTIARILGKSKQGEDKWNVYIIQRAGNSSGIFFISVVKLDTDLWIMEFGGRTLLINNE